MAGTVLSEVEIEDVRRALAGKSGGRSLANPHDVMSDLLATLDEVSLRARRLVRHFDRTRNVQVLVDGLRLLSGE